MKKIVRQIIKYRKKHDMSQQGLADKLGIARNTISRWESGFYNPSPLMVKVLRMNKIILSLTLVIMVSGCATVSRLNSLNIGMNKSDVLASMGTPNSTSANEEEETLVYELSNRRPDKAFSTVDTYYVVLRDNKVVYYGPRNRKKGEDVKEYEINIK